jgi:polysaccharide export outer membrane protein
MIGTGSYGINMFKKLSIISTAVYLCSCGIMPGMENLDTTRMRKVYVGPKIQPQSTLIPITPTLLHNQKVATYLYRIAPADVLHITVWKHPEFSAQEIPNITMAAAPSTQGAAGQAGYLVSAKGTIYFPLIGYVRVAGKTIDQVRNDISDRLHKFVPNPQVNVRVSDFRGQKIYVVGEIKSPGFLPINDQRLTIADALALSGGINPESADPRYIYVIRGNYVCPEVFWLDSKTPEGLLLAERFSLQPLDILYVSSAPAARWNRALNQLLPTIQTVWYTKSIVSS